MKSIQRMAMVAAILCVAVGTQVMQAQVVGGWAKASVRDPGVVAAARFAVRQRGAQERITLRKIVRARRQVVAGTNYEATLLVKHGRRSRRAVAVVWQKTDGTYELTSWKWVGR